MSETADQRLLKALIDKNFGELGGGRNLDEYFNLFAAQVVLRSRDLTHDQLEDGIVDGTLDCGVDGIWTFVDGRYVSERSFKKIERGSSLELEVLQAKNSSGFKETAIEKLILNLPSLLGLDDSHQLPPDAVNSKLQDRCARFESAHEGLAARFPSIRIHISYVTISPGSPHPNVKAKGDRLESVLRSKAKDVRASVSFVDAPGLRDLAKQAKDITVDLKINGSPVSTEIGDAYVCFVKLGDYYNFLRSSHGILRKELFESNVRDYAGSTNVNMDIKATLNEDLPDDFWCYNNGVTILAERARHRAQTFTLRNPQIVNGLQTSTEVFTYCDTRAPQDERALLVRVVVPSSGSTRDRVIRATNSQTQLPPGALRATERRQIVLEEWLGEHGYHYERRANHYKNLGVPTEKLVSMAQLARVFVAIAISKPEVALSQAESLLRDQPTYEAIFSESFDLDCYVRALELMAASDSYLDERARNGDLPGGSIAPWRYHFAYATALLLTRSANLDNMRVERLNVDEMTEPRSRKVFELLSETYQLGIKKLGTAGLHEVAMKPELTRLVKTAVNQQISRGLLR